MKKNEVTLNCGEWDNKGWTVGKATCNGREYAFQVKHFEEASDYGIDYGRISKLYLVPAGCDARDAVLGYSRGWEKGLAPRGKGAEVKAIFEALVRKFN